MAVEISKKPRPNIFRSQRWENDHSRLPVSERQVLQKAPPKRRNIEQSPCMACNHLAGDYSESLQAKYLKAMSRFQEAGLLDNATIVDPKASPRVEGSRAHAKLAVRPASESSDATRSEWAIGLFKPDSHQVQHSESCGLHREAINALIPDLLDELEESAIKPYSESTHTGDLRYLAVRAAHKTEEVMVTFVVTSEEHRVALKAIVLRLRQKGHIIVSAFINVNPEQTNTIFGPLTKKLVGADGLRESVCGLIFEIGPTSFFQVNPWQAEAIYRRVESLAGHAPNSAVAWDLYCGTGQISLLLAQQGFRTLGIEENPKAIDDAQKNADRNRMEDTMSPSYIAARVEDVPGSLPSWAERPHLIVANPSRRGLAPAARELIAEGLASRSDARFIYVSCEAETMIRDLKELTASGRQIRQLECFDMFPHTEKLEWVAIIQ